MSSAKFIITPFTWDLLPAYSKFASTSFGAGSYQATEQYLRWLYECNPLSRGAGRDMWVARIETGDIIGCIHTLRLEWVHAGSSFLVPSLHNTMIHPAYRGVAGGMLILQAFKGEAHAFVPGAEGSVADTLRRMRFVAVPTNWSRKILRPFAAASARAASRLGWQAAPFQLKHEPSAVNVGRPVELEGCVALANRGSDTEFRPQWNEATFFWRFFHPDGPRHLLFVEGNMSCPAGYAVLSIGRRHGVALARIVDIQGRDSETVERLIQRCSAAIRRQGGAVLLNYSSGAETAVATGLQRHPATATTLIYHRTPSSMPTAYRFNASAGDYGFEAILTRP